MDPKIDPAVFEPYKPFFLDPGLKVLLYRHPHKQKRVSYFFQLERGGEAFVASFNHRHPITRKLLPGTPSVMFGFDMCRFICDSCHEDITRFRRVQFAKKANDIPPEIIESAHKTAMKMKRQLRRMLGERLYLHLISTDFPGLRVPPTPADAPPKQEPPAPPIPPAP